jgi:hypothetical protein
MPPQVAATSGIAPTGQKKTTVALAAVIAVLVIALVGLGLFIFIDRLNGSSQGDSSGGSGQSLTPPRAPRAPEVPSQPSSPPPASSISGEMIYPGAKITMDMSGGPKGRVLKLSTPDAVDKVADWYINKIGSAKQIRIPGGSTVLSGNGIAVVITVEGPETSIILTQK